jgi:L-ribulose-5-phosphate 3-epimerase UlaE
MEVLPREISVGEFAVSKMPIGAIRQQGQEILQKAIDFARDIGLRVVKGNAAWFARCPK